MTLTLDYFERAVKTVVDGYAEWQAEPQRIIIRDGAIQRFEYTYELAWKMLQRVLSLRRGSENVVRLARKDLFRLAADQGLINDPAPWFIYHDRRHNSTQEYVEEHAAAIGKLLPDFLRDVTQLAAILKTIPEARDDTGHYA